MNLDDCETPQRSLVLELWWLKARRATVGQNAAAMRAGAIDSLLTALNVVLPIILLAFGAMQSLSRVFDEHSAVSFIDVVFFGTGCTAALSIAQLVGDYKVRALHHRQASCEFDAIGNQIERIGFHTDDDDLFNEIASRLERVMRTSPHVPGRDWQATRRRYHDEINRTQKGVLESGERYRVRRVISSTVVTEEGPD